MFQPEFESIGSLTLPPWTFVCRDWNRTNIHKSFIIWKHNGGFCQIFSRSLFSYSLSLFSFWILHFLLISCTVIGHICGSSLPASVMVFSWFLCWTSSFCLSWHPESKGQTVKERENRARIMVYRPWLWKIDVCRERSIKKIPSFSPSSVLSLVQQR